MNRIGKLFWAIVAAQCVFLAAWAAYHETVRRTAPVITLQVRPVDPQDILRGDYMILRYAISEVEGPEVASLQVSVGENVWVLLRPEGRYHVIATVARERPVPKPGQVLVRAQVTPNWRARGSGMMLAYGIENYFVPEGMGTPRFKQMEVDASVSPGNRLYIRRVLVDGQPMQRAADESR